MAKRMARHYAGRLIPLIGAPIGAIQNARRHQGARPAGARLLRAPVDRHRGAARSVADSSDTRKRTTFAISSGSTHFE